MAFHADQVRGAFAVGTPATTATFDLSRIVTAWPTAATPQNWRIAGIFFLIGAEAILYGYSYPFFSLALEKYGIANWLIGLNASLAGAGILIVGPFLPRLIYFFGLRRLVAGLFFISLLSFAVLLTTEAILAWFVSRFVMGACFAALWSTTEIWLNGVVDDRRRGRIIGASAMLYASAQFIGPLALSGTGVTGALPLVAAMLPLAAGVIVALSIRSKAGAPHQAASSGPESLRLAFTLASPLIVMAFLAGVTETTLQSLLPLYGLAYDMTDAEAARLVALFSIGEAVLVGVLGWVADRYGRRRTFGFCAMLAVLVMVLLPASIFQFSILGPALFLAGGVISGIYTLGVIEIGQEHRGQRLAVVSTGFAMAYAAGAVVGSTPAGFAIDLFGPNSLPIVIAGCFLLMAVTIVLRRERRVLAPAASVVRPPIRRPTTSVPVSPAAAFVTSTAVPLPPRQAAASVGDQRRRVHVEAIPVAEVQVGNDDQWQERHLEKWFKQRAVEIASRAVEREQRLAHVLEGLGDRETDSVDFAGQYDHETAAIDETVHPEAGEGAADVPVPVAAFDEANLGEIVRRVRRLLVTVRRDGLDEPAGQDAPRRDADRYAFRRSARYPEIVRRNLAKLDAAEADRRKNAARRKQLVGSSTTR